MALPDTVIGDATDFAAQHADAFPLFTRLMIFKSAGDQLPEHTHRDGHFTAVLLGVALFNLDGRLVRKGESGPELVWIPAGVKHQITAEVPNTICACIHDKRAFEV